MPWDLLINQSDWKQVFFLSMPVLIIEIYHRRVLYNMFIGILLALSAAFSHSISFISRKKGLEKANYKLFIFLRVILGILFSGTLLWALGPGLSGLNIRISLPFIITGSLAGGFGALFTTTLAIHYIGASRSHAITSSSPLITAAGEIIFLGAVITLPIIIGTICVVIGSALISFLLHKKTTNDNEEIKTKSHKPFLGLIFATYTVFAIGIQLVLHKWGLEMGASPLQGVFIHSLTAAILFGFFWLFRKPNLELDSLANIQKSGNFLIAGLAMAVLPVLNLFALTFLSATVVSALMRVAPLFTVALTHRYLKGIETINWKVVVSTCLIVTGAILVSVQ